LNAESIITLLAALVIGLVIAEWGAYRAEKRIRKAVAGAGTMLEDLFTELEEKPDKHPKLSKIYKLVIRACDVATNVLDEVEEETKKQQESKETKKADTRT